MTQSSKHDYGKAPSFSAAEAQRQAGNDFTVPADITADFERRLQDLENRRVNLNTDVFGLFETVSAVPAGVPRDLYDQIKIYKNATTYRLYWYDKDNAQWRYAVGV